MNGKLCLGAAYNDEVADDKLSYYYEYNYPSDTLVEYISYSINGNNDTVWNRTGLIKSHAGLLKEAIFLYRSDHPARDTISIKYYYDSNKYLIKTVEDDGDFMQTNDYQYNDDGLISKQILNRYNYEYTYEYEKGTGNAQIMWHNPSDFVFRWPNDINLINY